jgi:hypothetical protein
LHGSHNSDVFLKNVGKQFVQFPAKIHYWQPVEHAAHDKGPVKPVG